MNSNENILLPRLDDRDGPAARLEASAARALVIATVNAHQAKSQPVIRRRFGLAAAAILLLGMSAAVSAAYLLHSQHGAPTPSVPGTPPRATVIPVIVPPPAAELPARPEIELQRRREPIREPIPIEQGDAPAPVSAMADLLAEANQLRGKANWRQATQKYLLAVRTAPNSPEAYTALVAAGALQLEKLQNPRGALALFSRALASRPSGPLSEEARWGLVQANHRLLRMADEQRALAEFLEHHPSSVLAAEARQRLHPK